MLRRPTERMRKEAVNCSQILPTSPTSLAGLLLAAARQHFDLPYWIISLRSYTPCQTGLSTIRIEIILSTHKSSLLHSILHQITQRINGFRENERIAIFLQAGRDCPLPIQ